MMMDTQDTNQPLNEGKLEEEKKSVEVTESATTSTEEVSAAVAEEPVTEAKATVPETQEPVAATNEVPAEEAAETVEAVKEVEPEAPAPAAAEEPAEKEAPKVEEETAVEDEVSNETDAEVDEEQVKKYQHFNNNDEVIARLKEISEGDCQVSKQEIDALKQAFYKIHMVDVEEAKKKFMEDGGAEADFMPMPDSRESEFKDIMAKIKAKRSENAADLERIKEQNLQIKLTIIDELKDMVESPEEANYNEFKKIQQQWNDTKPIPQERANELWKSYQLYVEKFYDILKLNNEFREYDFKKNLQIKTRLCEIAEKLNDEPDVISAFHQLQKLHQEFRDTGPVAKELREAIWQRFKNASSAINRRHQQHFESLKEEEQHNLDQKTVICEIIEAIEWDTLKSFIAWEEKTQEIIALQNKWKTIGFVPKKMNTKIFERFRKDCDDFFKRKGDFFKTLKEGMNANLAKKRELVKKAEELKDSTDWKATADALTKLQKEWKTIGPVAKKYSDVVWKQFITACDFFFEQKNKANNSQHSAEMENLEKKKAIINQLSEISEDMEDDEANDKVRGLIKDWNGIGHVPFKEKDKIYEQFHSKVDELFKRFHISASNRNLNNFRSSISSQGSGSSSLYRERDKLVRAFESMKSELQTYENNLGFLSSSSKSGSSLLNELNRKVEKLKADLELAQQKIKMVNEQINQEADKE
jgi:pterin-4a-carbinolamine dehydratase